MAKNNLKKVLAFILVASLSATQIGLQAFAESGSGTLEDPSVTTVTGDPVDNGDGTVTTTTITTSTGTGTNEAGGNVTVETIRTEETTTGEDGTKVLGIRIEEGSVTTVTEKSDGVFEIVVDLTDALRPEDGADSTTVTGTADTSDPVVTGSGTPEDPATTVSETPREVVVIVEAPEVIADSGLGEEYEPGKEIGLSPIEPEWTGEEKDTNRYSSPNNPNGNAPEGYELYFSNYGEDSAFGVKLVKKDQNGNIIETDHSDVIQFELTDTASSKIVTDENGNPIQAVDKDGKPVFDETGAPVYQYEPVIHTGYCVDLSTSTRSGYWYRVENLEEAGYYSEEDAEHIRAIVLNGYWGTEPTEDDPAPTGSLAAFKKALKEAGQAETGLTDAEIDALTEGQAGTATQMAIWMYGNQIKDEFELTASDYNGGSTNESDKNAEKRSQIDKIAAYLAKQVMTREEAGTTEIIDADTFIDEMSLTVGGKVGDHANNNDDDDTNDAYNVDLTFSLVVTPSAVNDDLIVKVINSNGDVVKTARIAGQAQDGETFDRVEADADGNYTLTSLELIEGSDAEFNLKLEGAQYLEQGVYIYKSQVEGKASSQTFVGIAEGYRSVDVTMSVDLTFNVEEGTITTEQVWNREWSEDYDDEGDVDPDEDDYKPYFPDKDEPKEEPEVEPETVEIPEEDTPLADTPAEEELEIFEDEIPLSGAPKTGDTSSLWTLLIGAASAALAGVSIRGRRREED